MKCFFSLWMLTATLACAQEQVVHLKNGRSVKCDLLQVTESSLKIRAFLGANPRAGSSVRTIQRSTVKGVYFPLSKEAERRLSASSEAELPEFLKWWTKEKPRLSLPRSHAGRVGLVYADLLSQSERAERLERAVAVYQEVEKRDWSEERRALATEGRLRTLIALGKPEEALREAGELAKQNDNPRLLIEANYVIAAADFVALKELVEEHPRWVEEDLIRPKRDRLYNSTLDLFLYPFLFHGSREEQAARGLWGACEVAEHAKDLALARQFAGDIVTFYPAVPLAETAKTFLKKNPPS